MSIVRAWQLVIYHRQIIFINHTFLGIRCGALRCHKHIVLGSRFAEIFSTDSASAAATAELEHNPTFLRHEAPSAACA